MVKFLLPWTFPFVQASIDQITTHIRKGNLIYWVHQFKCYCYLEPSLQTHPDWAPYSRVTLIYNINYHTWLKLIRVRSMPSTQNSSLSLYRLYIHIYTHVYSWKSFTWFSISTCGQCAENSIEVTGIKVILRRQLNSIWMNGLIQNEWVICISQHFITIMKWNVWHRILRK